jgi:hypothetical protein
MSVYHCKETHLSNESGELTLTFTVKRRSWMKRVRKMLCAIGFHGDGRIQHVESIETSGKLLTVGIWNCKRCARSGWIFAFWN